MSALPTLVALALLITGCAALAPFNRYSFDETARLTGESLRVIGKARKPYRAHAREADSVMAGTRRAYRDASIRTQNQASMRHWETLLDSSQGSLAGTLRAWRHNDTLPAAEIKRAKKRIAADFDAISRLESEKAR